MDLSVPQVATTELAAAYFQAVLTVALGVVALQLYHRYQKAYFRNWALAWGIYVLRLGAIIVFLHTGRPVWLYWHQVFTGWTALALLWAALVFAQQIRWKDRYWILVLFPAVWSYAAIYRLDNFLLAAGPAVLFLSAATMATAWAFFRYHRETSSNAARVLAVFLALWALHHLDYPFLRARGIWNPWGYYLDLVFELGIGAGILLLVQEDLDEGLRALSSLSAELQSGRGREALPEALIQRTLELRAVRGSALFWSYLDPSEAGVTDSDRVQVGLIVAASGTCARWRDHPPERGLQPLLVRVLATAEPHVSSEPERTGLDHPYVAALPIFQRRQVAGALIVVCDARDPFTALDNSFLVALGQQMGAALRNAELNRRLADRTAELERLQDAMVERHEEEREQISRALHDETAQVLAAVNLRLGLLQEKVGAPQAQALDDARTLLGDGIRSIRQVARNLRPVALDDLGLLSALRALVRDLRVKGSLEIEAHLPAGLPPLSPAAELALYRTAQEGLANAARHGRAGRVALDVTFTPRRSLRLSVSDDGCGFPPDVLEGTLRPSSGLAGIRERIAHLGGEVDLGTSSMGGAALRVSVPLSGSAVPARPEPSDAVHPPSSAPSPSLEEVT